MGSRRGEPCVEAVGQWRILRVLQSAVVVGNSSTVARLQGIEADVRFEIVKLGAERCLAVVVVDFSAGKGKMFDGKIENICVALRLGNRRLRKIISAVRGYSDVNNRMLNDELAQADLTPEC